MPHLIGSLFAFLVKESGKSLVFVTEKAGRVTYLVVIIWLSDRLALEYMTL